MGDIGVKIITSFLRVYFLSFLGQWMVEFSMSGFHMS